MKKIKDIIVGFIYDFIYMPLFFNLIYINDLKKIKKNNGKFKIFNNKYFRKNTVTYYKKNNPDEIKSIHNAEIVNLIHEINLKPQKILLDGDTKEIVSQFKKIFKFNNSEVLTVGIGHEFDYDWNFENDPPKNISKNNDLIISQAMFEHLIDPYKHLKDLVKILKNKGYLIIHTQLPGYPYHRYPIDCLRFYPDWFESCGKKLGLKVKKRIIRNFHLCYLFQNT